MKRWAALSIFGSLIVGGVFVAHFSQVSAQTPTQVVTPPPINLDSGGISAADFSKQLADLNTTYRDQLTTYRSDEKTFQIDKDQYYQIQTLASLEEAVKQTRQVMLTRLDVIQTYFAIARLTLQNTKGIATDAKASSLQQLDTLIADLKTHRTFVSTATDRTTLLNAAVQFNVLSPRITTLSNKLSYLVIYGNLQTVADKTETIKQELQTQTEQTETDPLKLAEKKRGLDEVQRNLDLVNTPLVKIRTELGPTSTTILNSSSMSTDFSTVYSGLSRSLSYLQELVKN